MFDRKVGTEKGRERERERGVQACDRLNKNKNQGKTAERTKVLEILELNGYPENFIREVERKLKNYKTHELRMSEEMGNKDEENGCFTSSLTMPYVRGLSEPAARALRPLSIRVAHKAEP